MELKQLLADDKQEAAAWLALDLSRELPDIGDLPWLVGCIGKHAGLHLLLADETEVCIKSHRLICSVDAGNVPNLAAAAGQNGALARISAYIACFIPDCRQLAEEILHLLRLGKEALRAVGKMLETALEKHCKRKLVCIRGDVRML